MSKNDVNSMRISFQIWSWLRFLTICSICYVGMQASVLWIGFYKGYEPVTPWSESWTAQKKFTILSDKMDSSVQASPPYYSYAELLRNLGFFPMVPGINLELNMERTTWRPKISDRKTLHTQGTYGRVRIEWTPDAKMFSGVFQDDISNYVILNYSNGFRLPKISNFYGISMNIFRTGAPPATLLTAFNFFSVPSWNIFDYLHCNHYNWIYALPLLPFSKGRAGQQWTSFFSMMGVSDFGTFDGDGNLYTDVKTPWALCFKPSSKLRAEFEGFPPFKHSSELLQFIQPGELMYELVAITDAQALMYTDEERFMKYVVKVGDIYLQQPFQKCEYCDSTYWARHTRMEEDLALNPRWIPIATNLKYLIRTGSTGIYQHIHPVVTEDMRNYQLALVKNSDQMLRFFSTEANFVELLRQFGVTPQQLWEDQIWRTAETLKISAEKILYPSSNDEEYPYLGATLKVSPRWLYRIARNMGDPLIQYWKGQGIKIRNENIFDEGRWPDLSKVVTFSNLVLQKFDTIYDQPNLARRYRSLTRFMRVTSPFFNKFSDNLCRVFDNSLFFMNCDEGRSWMLEQACHIYVLADAISEKSLIPQDIVEWRYSFCLEDPPIFVEMTEPLDVGNTLFKETPMLKWPVIDDEFIERIAEELKEMTTI